MIKLNLSLTEKQAEKLYSVLKNNVPCDIDSQAEQKREIKTCKKVMESILKEFVKKSKI